MLWLTRLAASAAAFTRQPAPANATRAGHARDVLKYATRTGDFCGGMQTLAPSHESRRQRIVKAPVRDCPTRHAQSAQVAEPTLQFAVMLDSVCLGLGSLQSSKDAIN